LKSKIRVNEDSLLYSLLGDGVFRTLRVENGIPLNLSAHLEKLSKECQSLNIQSVLPTFAEIASHIKNENANTGIWRLKIAVLAEERLNLTCQVPGKVILTIAPYTPDKRPLRLGIYPHPFHRLNYAVKSLSYQDQLALHTWALKHGYDEVLTTTPEGYILEGAFTNVFWQEGDVKVFIEPSLPYYQGLTQELLIASSKSRFAKITSKELASKKVYICNSLKGVCPAYF
jgi:4-amino-4-deoxychorismate lyase